MLVTPAGVLENYFLKNFPLEILLCYLFSNIFLKELTAHFRPVLSRPHELKLIAPDQVGLWSWAVYTWHLNSKWLQGQQV